MNDREKTRTEYEARKRAGDPRRSTGRGEAVNRYLGALGYRHEHADRPASVAPTAPRQEAGQR